MDRVKLLVLIDTKFDGFRKKYFFLFLVEFSKAPGVVSPTNTQTFY